MPRAQRSWSWGLVLAGVASTLLTACGTDSGAAAESPSEEVLAAMDRIRTYGETTGSAYYTGIEPGSQSVTVYRRPDAGFDRDVREIAADVRVSLKASHHTLRENEQLQFAIANTRHPDYQVTGVSARPDGDVLIVAVKGDADMARADLARRYPDRIEVKSGGQIVDSLQIPFPATLGPSGAPT